MLPEAALLLDAPGVVHRRADGAEDAERAPDQRERAGDAEGQPCWSRNASSCLVMKSNCVGKYRSTNVSTALRSCVVGRGAAEHRERQQEERKQRQQGVVGDRRRVGQVVAAVEAEESAPRRQTGQPSDVTRAPADRARAASRGHYVRRSAPTPPTPAATSVSRYAGTLAPSHQRRPRTASRRSGGVVITTYAAATPAETRITFATVRAAVRHRVSSGAIPV